MGDIEKRITDIEGRLDEIEKRLLYIPDTGMDILVTLYSQQRAWTTAPREDEYIGRHGNAGEGHATLSLAPGGYQLVATHTVKTSDYGAVRWLKLRCGYGDTTTTNDGFAWVWANPDLMDCEGLYRDLKVDVDDYTKWRWDG